MTVLSRALTAETPEERWKALQEEAVGKNCGVGLGSDMHKLLISEYCLNERTLFIAAGDNKMAVQGLPAHFLSPPSKVATGTPSGETVGGGNTPAVAAPPTVVSPPAPNPHGPGTGPGPVKPVTGQERGNERPDATNAEKDALIKRLMDYSSSLFLPQKAWERLGERENLSPPWNARTTAQRLDYLRQMPMNWLKYVVTGEGAK